MQKNTNGTLSSYAEQPKKVGLKMDCRDTKKGWPKIGLEYAPCNLPTTNSHIDCLPSPSNSFYSNNFTKMDFFC